MWLHIPTFQLLVLLLLSTLFLAQHWYSIGKKFLFLVGDHGFENQWTFVTSSSNRSSATGAEDRAASRRKALRLIFSKAFLAKVALCTIASISLISSMLHICFLWWLNWSAHSNRESFEKIVLAFERIVDDKERIEWEQLSERVNSTAFATSYYLTFFWGLLFWFFVVRRVYQVFPRLAAPATLHDLRSTLKLLYQKLSHERKFRFALVAALVLTLAWWYLDRSAAIVFNDDPYSILDLMDLTQPVSVKEIKKAYRRKSMQYTRYD